LIIILKSKRIKASTGENSGGEKISQEMLLEKQNLIDNMKKDFGSVLDILITSGFNSRK